MVNKISCALQTPLVFPIKTVFISYLAIVDVLLQCIPCWCYSISVLTVIRFAVISSSTARNNWLDWVSSVLFMLAIEIYVAAPHSNADENRLQMPMMLVQHIARKKKHSVRMENIHKHIFQVYWIQTVFCPLLFEKKAKRTNRKKRKLAEWSKKLLKIKYDFVRPEPFGYRQMFIQ